MQPAVLQPWEEKIAEARSTYHPWIAEIIEAAKAYRDAALDMAYHPQSHKSSCPEDDEEGREYLRIVGEFDKARGRLLNACLCGYHKNSEIPLAANTWIVCKVRAQGDAEVSMGTHPDSGARMHDLMEAEERLMEACGLASAASPLARTCLNRGVQSKYGDADEP